MDERERFKLEELKIHVKCDKNFACVKSKFKKLCSAQYNWEINELECLEEDNSRPCKFATSTDSRLICDCDLRIFIPEKQF